MQKLVTNAIKIAGKVYQPGLHEFSAEVMKDPHYEFYSRCGRIISPKVKENVKLAKTEEALAIEARYGIKQKPAVVVESEPVKKNKK